MINPLSNLPQIYNYYVSTIIRFMFTDPLPTYNDLHFSRLKKCDELGMCLQLETLTWKNKKKCIGINLVKKKNLVLFSHNIFLKNENILPSQDLPSSANDF